MLGNSAETSTVPLPKLFFGKIHEGQLEVQVPSPITNLKTSNKPWKSYSEKK